jgi:hypothetical protein
MLEFAQEWMPSWISDPQNEHKFFNDHLMLTRVQFGFYHFSHYENKFFSLFSFNPSGAHRVHPVFSGVRIAQSLVFCVVLCRTLFFFVFFFNWPLNCLPCLSFLDLGLLIVPFASSIFSWTMSELDFSIIVVSVGLIYLFICTLFFINI